MYDLFKIVLVLKFKDNFYETKISKHLYSKAAIRAAIGNVNNQDSNIFTIVLRSAFFVAVPIPKIEPTENMGCRNGHTVNTCRCY